MITHLDNAALHVHLDGLLVRHQLVKPLLARKTSLHCSLALHNLVPVQLTA